MQEVKLLTQTQVACRLTSRLCLCEKLFIVKNMNNPKLLNKRSAIGNKCTLHKKKHFLDRMTYHTCGGLVGVTPLAPLGPGLETTTVCGEREGNK